MRMILKKNQVIISVIALMLIAAGYMNYTANSQKELQVQAGLLDTEQYADLGDATLVSANIQGNSENIVSNESSSGIIENAQETSISVSTSDRYFTESRLTRDNMYSQMIESYQNILNNTQISEEQKTISQNEIVKINETKNAIMIAENLIKNKGFDDIIIFVNGDSINVIVKTENLNSEQIAQIQNIIQRELKSDIENIHISSKS